MGLSQGDRRKFERLCDRFDKNFRLTRLQALYLERFPEALDAGIVDSVCESGSISRECAIAALISELFGLDTAGSADDRALFRDYIIPSIRILDAEKYRNDPYYKNIPIPNVKDGDWELRTEAYEPYRAVICQDMTIDEDFKEIAPMGFFTERFEFPAVLEGGNEWMTLTPVDLDTCSEAISQAHGRVVTFGLGLGYYAYMASEKPCVSSVTVVEKSEKVIELFKKYILPHFPHREKVKIINCDAFEYAEKIMPEENFDLAFVDTWRDASDGAEMYIRMKPMEALNPSTEFLYWIEGFILSRLRALELERLREKYEVGELNLSYEEILRRLSKDYLGKHGSTTL